MDKLLTIILLLNISVVFGQTNPYTYRFSKDILYQIDSDTVPWKYQRGATELSFIGNYRATLEIWDKSGMRKPQIPKDDSLFFINGKQVNAKDYIVAQSKNVEIIIINEAHHISKHRLFTKSLLKDLFDNGYRYLGLEALFDSTINERKYPIIASGYYTQEPEFGNLIAEALNIGFTLFGYEASLGKNGRDREMEQAENIQNFIERNPKGKVLIHCGYAHAFENDYPAWGKAMAGRLKENMKIDPLTIDQTMFLEKSDTTYNHLFITLNNTKDPFILIDKNENVYNGVNENKQTDIVVIHPQTSYINNRPEWLMNGRKKYIIPFSRIAKIQPLLILAYRNNEFEHKGIPTDIIEIIDNKSARELYLADGNYTIVLIDKDHNIIDKYSIEIK